jgi:RNA polymerase sigma factor (sigma-70 family)
MSRKSSISAREFEAEAIGQLSALLGVASRLTRNNADAQDLVQDTLLKAMRARDQFEAGTNMRAWLLRILTNTFINRYRRGGLERSVLDGPDADPLADGRRRAVLQGNRRHHGLPDRHRDVPPASWPPSAQRSPLRARPRAGDRRSRSARG